MFLAIGSECVRLFCFSKRRNTSSFLCCLLCFCFCFAVAVAVIVVVAFHFSLFNYFLFCFVLLRLFVLFGLNFPRRPKRAACCTIWSAPSSQSGGSYMTRTTSCLTTTISKLVRRSLRARALLRSVADFRHVCCSLSSRVCARAFLGETLWVKPEGVDVLTLVQQKANSGAGLARRTRGRDFFCFVFVLFARNHCCSVRFAKQTAHRPPRRRRQKARQRPLLVTSRASASRRRNDPQRQPTAARRRKRVCARRRTTR